MKVTKVAFGNASEAFIETRLVDGVNIIFSNDNNKGKTILIQGMMYALGNEPIFPSGFDYKTYYFYVNIEHKGIMYEFLRKNNSITIKFNGNIHLLDTLSELKYFVDVNIFSVPKIMKDDQLKTVDLSLLYQLFVVGQDKRNPASLFNAGYYNKTDFINMIFSMADCLILPDDTNRLRELKRSLQRCKNEIEAVNRKLKFYMDHPELAKVVSSAKDKEQAEADREILSEINSRISELEKTRIRVINRKIKLEGLFGELNSLNRSLQSGKVRCKDCGSTNITYDNADLSFELTNDIVRKNIMDSIVESIKSYEIQVEDVNQQLVVYQNQLRSMLSETPKSWIEILLYVDEIKSCEENEDKLLRLLIERDSIQSQIDVENVLQDNNSQTQKDTIKLILESMNELYNSVDPAGNLNFTDIFATRNMTFSGSEEQEYYYSRTIAIYWVLKYDFPIVMDCFRQGELSTKKEAIMIDEYIRTNRQVILTSTLKDEEYQSGTKYYSIPGVNAINYETNVTCKILQPDAADIFADIIRSFGVII